MITVEQIFKLVKNTPNNMVLGSKLREFYFKTIEKMSAKQELYEQIADQFAILESENGSTTKAGQARARKAAGEIKKLITPYKKANMEEVKS